MGIQNVIRLLVPKEEHFFDFVEKAAVYTWDAAVMLATFSQDGNTAEAVRLKVQDAGQDFRHPHRPRRPAAALV